jgi:hypothetical protein
LRVLIDRSDASGSGTVSKSATASDIFPSAISFSSSSPKESRENVFFCDSSAFTCGTSLESGAFSVGSFGAVAHEKNKRTGKTQKKPILMREFDVFDILMSTLS